MSPVAEHGGMWPVDPQELMALQVELAAAPTEPWRPPADPSVAACWVSFGRGPSGHGSPGDPAWAGAVIVREGKVVARHEKHGACGAQYARSARPAGTTGRARRPCPASRRVRAA